MTKEQLNKIDEEFGIIKLLEDLITVVSDTDILDTDDVENFYRNEDRIINSQKIDNAWKALNLKGKLASIFHSKLQEAYELGREEAYDFLTQQYEVSKRIEDRIRKDERERIKPKRYCSRECYRETLKKRASKLSTG